jgi:hypothetical protein
MSRFFVSYRRDDAEAEAGRIADRFRAEFGDDEVFFDTSAIDPGEDWRRSIVEALTKTEVMLVVIGRSWLTLAGKDGRPRIHDADDFVAFEIATALQRGTRVVPVLVQGATLPSVQALPAALAKLPDFNDHEVRAGAAFGRDVEALIDAASSRRRGWRRLLPQGRARAAVGIALVLGHLPIAFSLRLVAPTATLPGPVEPTSSGSDAGTTRPTHFDLQLQVRLRDTPGDDRQVPFMKLWHERPNPNRADNINLLDQARALATGVLAYESPIPAMPTGDDHYEGLMSRLVLTGQISPAQTRICFAAADGKGREPIVKMDCEEGRDCTLAADDFGWARPQTCPPRPGPVAWLPFVSSAHAAGDTTPVWAVPSLETLQDPRNAGRAWSEVRLESDALPALKQATAYTWAASINGRALYVDGLPPEAYRRAYDPAKGLDLRFGMENLDASGLQGGYDDVRITLRFFAGETPLRSVNLRLRYVALRDIPGPRPAVDGDIALRWSAQYHPGRAEDRFQVFMVSSPGVAGLDALKARFDQAGLTARVGSEDLPLVAVLRPPYEANPNYGLNVGLRQRNGQIRFSFDDATSQAVCAAVHRIALQRPGVARTDSYRRSLDGSKEYARCSRWSAG